MGSSRLFPHTCVEEGEVKHRLGKVGGRENKLVSFSVSLLPLAPLSSQSPLPRFPLPPCTGAPEPAPLLDSFLEVLDG